MDQPDGHAAAEHPQVRCWFGPPVILGNGMKWKRMNKGKVLQKFSLKVIFAEKNTCAKAWVYWESS